MAILDFFYAMDKAKSNGASCYDKMFYSLCIDRVGHGAWLI